jgi:hypothetical protein
MSAGTVIEQALGQFGVEETISVTVETYKSTTSTAGGEAAFGPGTLDVKRSDSSGKKRSRLSKPVGSGTDNLGWVAEQFKAKRRTPVFEDFHNLSTEDQVAMAYVIKALGEWEVPCIVVGIWTDTHLLKLYNGELEGRIVDVALKWNFDDLREVVSKGCSALNVEMSDEMIDKLVRASYTSVGLLQELCAATLHAAGIDHRPLRHQKLDDPNLVVEATKSVVTQIDSRFEPFIQRLSEVEVDGDHPNLYGHLVEAVQDRLSEPTLLSGVATDELITVLIAYDPDLERASLVDYLQELDEVQRTAGINPPVLAYDVPREKLLLVDRRLLLFLKEAPRS